MKSRLISLLLKNLCNELLNCIWSSYRDLNSRPLPYQGSALPLSYKSKIFFDGAGDEDRTRDMQLGRLPLYQLSYSRTTLVFTTSIEVNGGERRIRTFETFVAELQSAPFDRSGISPFYTYYQCCSFYFKLETLRWCRHTDSNCGPTDYKSVALPTELCRLFLSFRTFRIGTVCSLAKTKICASVFY